VRIGASWSDTFRATLDYFFILPGLVSFFFISAFILFKAFRSVLARLLSRELPNMSKAPLTTAILVVSTTAARDSSADASDAILRSVFETDGLGSWDVVETKIVADNVPEIQKQVMRWADGPESVNLIVTTGGTGFAVADYTPEAISVLLQKSAPGLVHGMLSASLAVTPCMANPYHPTSKLRC